jgi:hypothetical protein
MRCEWLLASVAAVMTSQVARAEGVSPVPAGLIDAPNVGVTFVEGVDRPGLRLSHNLRFRIDGFSDNIAQFARGISPLRTQSLDPTRRRRFNSLVDFFPVDESGFHFTAGMRRAPKRARWNPAALSEIEIFTPKGSSPLRVRSNVARSSPMAMLGWSGGVGDDVKFSLGAGAMQQHGRELKATAITIARQQPLGSKWSGIGAVASAAMRWRF